MERKHLHIYIYLYLSMHIFEIHDGIRGIRNRKHVENAATTLV